MPIPINPKLLEYIEFLKNFVSQHQSFFDNLHNFKKSDDTEEANPFDYLDTVGSTHPQSPYKLKEFIDLQEQFYDIFIAPYSSAIINFNGHLDTYDGKTLLDAGNSKVDWYNYFEKNAILDNMQVSIISNAISVAKFSGVDIRSLTITPFGYLSHGIELNNGLACGFCSQRLNKIYLDYDKLEILPYRNNIEPCTNKKSFVTKVKLSVPSKKLVFLNDIRKALYLKIDSSKEISFNSILGKMQQTDLYSEHNIGCFFVSNTSPTILQKDGQILIDTNYCDDKKDSKKYNDYIDKGYICTDLWSYFVLDYDLYEKTCFEANLTTDYFSHVVVDITSNSVNISHDFKELKSTIKYKK